MTEAARAALWRANRAARRAAVEAAETGRADDPAFVAEMQAGWEPVRLAQQERHIVEPLDDAQDAALRSPNVWTPGETDGEH